MKQLIHECPLCALLTHTTLPCFSLRLCQLKAFPYSTHFGSSHTLSAHILTEFPCIRALISHGINRENYLSHAPLQHATLSFLPTADSTRHFTSKNISSQRNHIGKSMLSRLENALTRLVSLFHAHNTREYTFRVRMRELTGH